VKPGNHLLPVILTGRGTVPIPADVLHLADESRTRFISLCLLITQGVFLWVGDAVDQNYRFTQSF
jgi:hypothetical protein